MTERLICLDTSVIIKYLTPEEHKEEATDLVLNAILDGVRLVAPAWVWAEVGTVLRKKVRAGLVTSEAADTVWESFRRLPIESVERPNLATRAWEIAKRYNLPTLYDAAFMACVEVVPAADGAIRQFWTADSALVRQLGGEKPAYVRVLGENGPRRPPEKTSP